MTRHATHKLTHLVVCVGGMGVGYIGFRFQVQNELILENNVISPGGWSGSFTDEVAFFRILRFW